MEILIIEAISQICVVILAIVLAWLRPSALMNVLWLAVFALVSVLLISESEVAQAFNNPAMWIILTITIAVLLIGETCTNSREIKKNTLHTIKYKIIGN